MKVAILGIDGYLGWPLALHLINQGHEVSGIDSFARRYRVHELDCHSLTPIEEWTYRKIMLSTVQVAGFKFAPITLGVSSPSFIRTFLQDVQPDAIVHLAEQPSAPWSMRNVEQASITQIENVIGTLHLLWAMHEVCPDAHLIKLGTMGEYGTPDCVIPEGEIPKRCLGEHVWYSNEDSTPQGYLCPMSGLQFPRAPGSWYHLTKVHDTYNIIFACKAWNLRSTDIMQGPVFGVKTEDMGDKESLITRFDYDEQFGTVINRFCVQALAGIPLTVYGHGGQTRGYLPLKDSIFCMTLAIENPPKAGEYRTFNQFERTYSINELAQIVFEAGALLEMNVKIAHYENPRKEAETHYYKPHRNKLIELGYKPTKDITPAVTLLLRDLMPYTSRIREHLVIPETRWDTMHRQSEVLK